MRAICVRQPYAELIARGIKTDEAGRSWEFIATLRGPIAICSSTQAHHDDETQATARKHGIVISDLPRGVVVCIVDVVDTGHYTEEHFSKEALCYVNEDTTYMELVNPRRVTAEPTTHMVRGVRTRGGWLNVFDLGFEPELARRQARPIGAQGG